MHDGERGIAAPASLRLSLAIDTGLSFADRGLVRLWHPPGDLTLDSALGRAVEVVQPDAVAAAQLAQRGISSRPVATQERAGAAAVFLPKAKALARHLVAQSCATTDGPVAIDGQKTAGIDPVFKALRGRAPISGQITKSHGRLFWLQGSDDLCPDWIAPPGRVAGFVTAPGVFSADGIDAGSQILTEALPGDLKGHVIDLGAGWGYLGAWLRAQAAITRLDLVEADHAALECARHNAADPRAAFHWADARGWRPAHSADVVVTNPPFHEGRAAAPALGQAFLENAARCLKPDGRLFAVANRHLPYERTMADCFADCREIAGDARFKVLCASRPRR